MGLRDDEYSLDNEIELDDGFFETVSINREKDEPLKRGRGSQRQTTVLVMAESKEVENENVSKKYECKKQFGFLKMKVIEGGLNEPLFTTKVKENVGLNATVNSDGSTSYTGLKVNYNHNPQTIPKKDAGKILPWVHRSISNAKRMLLDVHHRIDDDFLQNYLNAFVYKMNRRYFDNVFERLLVTAVSYKWNYLGETSG